MSDPRDPHAAERLAERDAAYRAGIAEYHATHDTGTHLDPDPVIRAQAVIDCGLCDDDGYRNNRVCDHVDRTATARAGIAKCREALTAKQLRLDQAAD
jgi:hypothetical protein